MDTAQENCRETKTCRHLEQREWVETYNRPSKAPRQPWHETIWKNKTLKNIHVCGE